MNSSPSYPGQFRRAVGARLYTAGRHIFGASNDGEKAHNLALRAGQILDHVPGLCAKLLGDPRFDEWIEEQGLAYRLGEGVELDTPFIAAPGLIKRHDMKPNEALHVLPIGAATIGGITPFARKGNDGKRVHVDEPGRNLVNFMGLNNSGISLWAAQLEYERDVLGIVHIPMIANIANDPLTPNEGKPEEAKEMVKKIAPFVHAIEYNASCPNVGKASGEAAFSGDSLQSIVGTLMAIHEGLKEAGKENVPVLLKLPPHLDHQTMERLIHATHHLVTGYTCINTSTSPELKKQTPIGQNNGGLSGTLIQEEMLRTVGLVREIAPQTTIIALGGLGTGRTPRERFEEGRRAILRGANLVSGYSGLVFSPFGMHDVVAGAITGLKERNN